MVGVDYWGVVYRNGKKDKKASMLGCVGNKIFKIYFHKSFINLYCNGKEIDDSKYIKNNCIKGKFKNFIFEIKYDDNSGTIEGILQDSNNNKWWFKHGYQLSDCKPPKNTFKE